MCEGESDRMRRLKSSVLAVLAAAVMISGSMLGFATPVEAQGSAALSIAPRKDYNMQPGKVIEDTLQIRNIDEERPLYLSLRVVDFTSTDDGGTPKLMLEENLPETEWSLRSILEVPESVTIEPGQSKSIDIRLNVPENQGPGSYYSAIISSSSASEGGNVGLSASGVTLVFAEMPGEVDEKLILEKVGNFDPASRDYKLFSMQSPTRIGYTIRNEGNVTGRPVGSITLKNIFGKETVINDINPNQSLALIGQTRTFEACVLLAGDQNGFDGSREEANTCVDSGLWPGFYSVELQGFYGRNGNNTQELIGTGYFFYLPLWFIIVMVVVLLFIGFYVWKAVRFIRSKSGKRSASRNKR